MLTGIIIGAISAIAGAVGTYIYYTKVMVQIKADLATARAHEQSLEREIRNTEEFAEAMGTQFKALASDALNMATDRLTEASKEKLEASGALINQSLLNTKETIQSAVNSVIAGLTGLTKQSTTIEEGLRHTYSQTKSLTDATNSLNELLSSSQARGAWGERMVEDILTKLGMVEGINYVKQTTIGSGERPDFTFLLPGDKKVHMDVKFPLAKYREYIEAGNTVIADNAAREFLIAVKGHVAALTKRDYVNVADGTIDLQIMFIPNEAIYSFIHQEDPSIADYAMDNKIVMCSPITFYGILSMINQAVKSFSMSQNIAKVMGLIANFDREFGKYTAEMDKIGVNLDRAKAAFDNTVTTRTNKLERSLTKINEITGNDGVPMLEGGIDA